MVAEARTFSRVFLSATVGVVLSLGLSVSAQASAPRSGAGTGALVQLAGKGSCVAQNTDLKGCTQAKALIGAADVAVSPDGSNVYVASRGDSEGQNAGMSAFARNQRSGRLTGIGCVTTSGSSGVDLTNGQCADGDALAGLGDVTVSPDGKNVYATAATSNAIDVFRRDPSSGAVTQLSCIQHNPPAGSHCVNDFPLQGPSDVVVSADGKFVYVSAFTFLFSGVMTYARDPGTGMLSPRGCVSNDGNDGICTTAPALDGVRALAITSDGANVYAAVSRSGSGGLVTFRRDPSTGVLTEADCLVAIAPAGSVCRNVGITVPTDEFVGNGATSVVVSPSGSNVYVAAPDLSTILGFDRNASSGKLSLDGCITTTPPPPDEEETDGTDEEAALSCAEAPGLGGVAELAMSPDGQTVYGTGSDSVVSLKRKAGGHLAAGGCIIDSGFGDGEPACSPATGLEDAEGIATSPDRANVYVAAPGSDAVSVLGPSVGIASARARLHDGRFTVELSCPASMTHACSGDLRVKLPTKRRAGHARVAARIASHRGYSLKQGTSRRFRIALPKTLAKHIESRRKADLIIEASQHAGDRRASARLITITG